MLSLEGTAYRRFGQVGSERSIEECIDDSNSIIIDFVEEILLNWPINDELHDYSPKTENAKICQYKQDFTYPFTLFAKLPC